MIETLQETEIKIGRAGKMVYIGPNVEGLLSGTVFDYMPELESLKEETLKLREKSNYLHFIYEEIAETKKRKGSVD